MGREYLFTSESVTSGHPDKVADQISDAILDAYLEGDPFARVACETLVTTGTVYITGEISSEIDVDEVQIVRNTLREIGYADERYGMDADTCEVVINLDEQSADIAAGVDNALESRDTEEDILTGAGDQGLVFGYATNQTEAYLPEPIYYAHKLAKQLEGFRRFINFSGTKDILRPDGKTQVTVKYDGEEVKEIDTVVISAQHGETVMQEELETLLKEHVITEVIPSNLLTKNTKVLINPSGRFVTGGPEGDVGLTGRKIIVDTYGGWSRHGGGAYSGKDSTKVDRSGSYMARYIAKNIVAAKLAEECEVQLAYAIGKAEPVSVYVNTFGTAKGVAEQDIEEAVCKVFRLDPDGIIEQLDLRKPVFKDTAVYGHFGNSKYRWEQLDKVDELKKALV